MLIENFSRNDDALARPTKNTIRPKLKLGIRNRNGVTRFWQAKECTFFRTSQKAPDLANKEKYCMLKIILVTQKIGLAMAMRSECTYR